MIIGVLPGEMTTEFGNALYVIDGIALALFFLMIYAAKIAASSSRVFKFLGLSTLISRITLLLATYKSHKPGAPQVNPLPPIASHE